MRATERRAWEMDPQRAKARLELGRATAQAARAAAGEEVCKRLCDPEWGRELMRGLGDLTGVDLAKKEG